MHIVMGDLILLMREFTAKKTYLDPMKTCEKTKELLQKLRDYPQDNKDTNKEEPRLVRGLALYYLREIYDLAFLADAVDGVETDPDDKVNEALLIDICAKWLGTKPAYRIKPPFCNDHYTHKFVDEWYAERRYNIGTYGSIVVQLPSFESKEPKPPNWFHRFIGWCFAQGWMMDAAILVILLLDFLLPIWELCWSIVVYPSALLVAIIVWGCLWWKRGPHVLKAMVPRLAGCTIVGLLLPLATQEAWKFSFFLWKYQLRFWTLIVILLFASWLYLFVETHNHVGKNGLSICRAFQILLRLCNFALFFSWFATTFVSTLVPSLVPRIPHVARVSLVTIPLPTCLLFAVFAVFIGIFLQILWHERPITSRL